MSDLQALHLVSRRVPLDSRLGWVATRAEVAVGDTTTQHTTSRPEGRALAAVYFAERFASLVTPQ